MQSNQLLAGISRTRPATYKASVDADGRVVLRHWVDSITIVVERPKSAPFVTFTKFVGKDIAIKVTTPAGEFRNRLTIPDATLCWATLERFDRAPAGRDADHLIVRDGKILRQPRRGGSDARVGGSDARELARTRARAGAHARTHADPRARTRARSGTHARTRTRASTRTRTRARARVRVALDWLAAVLRRD